MDNALNPGSRPRTAVIAVLVAISLVGVVVAAAVVGTPDRADASGLAPFESCVELEGWGEEAQSFAARGRIAEDLAVTSGVASTMATSGAAASGADKAAAASESAALDATNVVVEGVDELDLVDRLGGERVLVVAGSTLAIVDLAKAQATAKLAVAPGAQVTYDRDANRAWVVGQSGDGTTVQVQRVTVGDTSLTAAGSWSTPGMLVDARRVGGQLHLVASDGFIGIDGRRIPFQEGPVPCDQVLHPMGPSDPTATLLVTLPVAGELQPSAAAEVVGSGQLVHVTDQAAYLATPQWGETSATTAIHRFDLADLTHTGSGSVPGTLLNDFSMSDHDGRLRVAITADSAIGRPVPMPVDDVLVGPDAPVGTDGSPGTIADDVVGPTVTDGDVGQRSSGSAGSAGAAEAAPSEAAPPDTTIPTTTVPTSTTTTVATTSTTGVPATTSTSTSTSTSTTTSTSTSTTMPTGSTIPGPGPDDPINKVVVLDTEGDLDVVGATPWFGHPGERLQGIRFDGSQAYAVTFLQTDPFYVLDLADPLDPKVAGEVQLPGFSAYLHPVGDGLVVGFGPDGTTGRQAAKLFDVSDPAAPKVVDTIVLGDDSPVVYDHHAFVDLGAGRFAVPVTSYPTIVNACPTVEGPAVDPVPGTGTIAPCQPDSPESQVVELEVQGRRLREVARDGAVLGGYDTAQRALPVGDTWALLGGAQLVVLGAGGTADTPIPLG